MPRFARLYAEPLRDLDPIALKIHGALMLQLYDTDDCVTARSEDVREATGIPNGTFYRTLADPKSTLWRYWVRDGSTWRAVSQSGSDYSQSGSKHSQSGSDCSQSGSDGAVAEAGTPNLGEGHSQIGSSLIGTRASDLKSQIKIKKDQDQDLNRHPVSKPPARMRRQDPRQDASPSQPALLPLTPNPVHAARLERDAADDAKIRAWLRGLRIGREITADDRRAFKAARVKDGPRLRDFDAATIEAAAAEHLGIRARKAARGESPPTNTMAYTVHLCQGVIDQRTQGKAPSARDLFGANPKPPMSAADFLAENLGWAARCGEQFPGHAPAIAAAAKTYQNAGHTNVSFNTMADAIEALIGKGDASR